jgi:signal transduction histidine kinase
MELEQIQKATILVVDDNPDLISLLFKYLTEMGLTVLSSHTGEEALRIARTESPDLILLDVLMPGLDGFEICQRLKKDSATRHIPVVFMTALGDSQSKISGFEAGGIDYITKPFQQQEVFIRIAIHLNLEFQRKELIRLNKEKDSFLSLIAHDMRNAMVPMIGLSALLSDEYGSVDNVYAVARKMDDYVKHANRLLENVLYWSSLQINKVNFQPERFDLQHVLLELRGLLRSYARLKEIEFEDTVPAGSFVFADQEMIRIVLRNVILNGIYFTPQGGKLSFAAREIEESLEIEVRDSGVGIPEENMRKLFKIDQKFSTAGTAGEHGSGLGLILCKELQKKNKGDIRIESQVDQGTTVFLTLPRIQA